MNIRAIARENERKILNAIKTCKKQDGYFVVSYKELSEKSGVSYGSIRNIIKRLLRKGNIEIRESYALFGSMFKKGIKILKDVE